MKACASTYSAFKLGALTAQQNHVRGGCIQGTRGTIRFKVTHVGIAAVEKMWDGNMGGVLCEDMGLEGGLYMSGEHGPHFFGAPGLSKRISEKGESDPMVDKEHGRPNSPRAPVVMQ